MYEIFIVYIDRNLFEGPTLNSIPNKSDEMLTEFSESFPNRAFRFTKEAFDF